MRVNVHSCFISNKENHQAGEGDDDTKMIQPNIIIEDGLDEESDLG